MWSWRTPPLLVGQTAWWFLSLPTISECWRIFSMSSCVCRMKIISKDTSCMSCSVSYLTFQPTRKSHFKLLFTDMAWIQSRAWKTVKLKTSFPSCQTQTARHSWSIQPKSFQIFIGFGWQPPFLKVLQLCTLLSWLPPCYGLLSCTSYHFTGAVVFIIQYYQPDVSDN